LHEIIESKAPSELIKDVDLKMHRRQPVTGLRPLQRMIPANLDYA
jgi:hypothetical protein